MNRLKEYCDKYGMNISDDQIEKFKIYYKMLIEWNKKVNLTAITDLNEVIIKHFFDSIIILKYINIDKGSKIIDVGTGAGFPSIPIKIMRSDIKVTMLDSLNKRITFLKHVSDVLEMDNQIVHGRAEDYGHDSEYREKYDYATARAVARLNTLCEYCIPFIKVGGEFIALKGSDGINELNESEQTIKLFNLKKSDVIEYELPNTDKRVIIRLNKLSQTATTYPRKQSKIKKNPL